MSEYRRTPKYQLRRPPYGYKQEIIEKQQSHKRTRTISRAVVDENTAPVVQRVFNLCEEGLGYKTIAMMLIAKDLEQTKANFSG